MHWHALSPLALSARQARGARAVRHSGGWGSCLSRQPRTAGVAIATLRAGGASRFLRARRNELLTGARFAPNLPLTYPRPHARATPHPTHVSHTFSGQSVAFTISPLSSPPHQLTTSPPHHLTISPPPHLTISPPHHLTISISHHLTISISHHLTTSPSHHLTISPPHHLTTSQSHHLPTSKSPHLTISPPHNPPPPPHAR